MSPGAPSILNVLTLSPSEGKDAWRRWRAETDLDQLDAEGLELLPLLSGRLLEWLPNDTEGISKNALLGICRRGWVQNQLRYRAAADVITILRQAGLEPLAIFGAVAWALLYAEEKAVRSIRTLEILIRRDAAAQAARAFQAAGWSSEPGMPVVEGPLLDQFAGIWLRSPTGVSLQLAWRLWHVSPELAQAHEAVPRRRPVDIQGAKTFVVDAEELLLEALTRDQEQLVSWQCDAIVLLRNRAIDWHRLRAMAYDFPGASARLSEIRGEATSPIPEGILHYRRPGRLGRRLSGIWVDYRQVCWARGKRVALSGFTAYLWKRLIKRAPARTSEQAS